MSIDLEERLNNFCIVSRLLGHPKLGSPSTWPLLANIKIIKICIAKLEFHNSDAFSNHKNINDVHSKMLK